MDRKKVSYFCDATSGLEIVFCQDNTISYPLHTHVSMYVLTLLIAGSLNIVINNEQVVLKENHFISIPPYVPHSMGTTASYNALSLCIPKTYKEQSESDWETVIKQGMRKFFRLLSLEYKDSLVDTFIHQFAKLPVYAEIHDAYVQGLQVYIERFPELEFSLEDMAQQACISKYHLLRNFKRQIGLPPHQFLLQNRIRKARILIQQGVPLTEAALIAGFYDQSHFTKNFVKRIGMSPLLYKKVVTDL